MHFYLLQIVLIGGHLDVGGQFFDGRFDRILLGVDQHVMAGIDLGRPVMVLIPRNDDLGVPLRCQELGWLHSVRRALVVAVRLNACRLDLNVTEFADQIVLHYIQRWHDARGRFLTAMPIRRRLPRLPLELRALLLLIVGHGGTGPLSPAQATSTQRPRRRREKLARAD